MLRTTTQSELFDLDHQPGGRSYPLPLGIRSSAVYGGPGNCYRYRLERVWNDQLRSIMFLLMNPSTATENVDDRTLQKVRKFATRWGYGRLLVGNTLAYRVTDQSRLSEIEDPLGPDNLRHLRMMAEQADVVVLGYGRPKIKALQMAGPTAANMLLEAGVTLKALRVSRDGTPWHPLYLPDHCEPFDWAGMAA